MTKFSCLTLMALALAGCASGPGKNEAPGPAATTTGLTPMLARTTDSRIAADRMTLDSVQGRLRKLNEAGVAQGVYPLAKAQCWLDTARTQYEENDRTGYIEESLAESVRIVQSLEADKTAKVGFDTPLVARSTRLRDDLWAQLGQLKSQDSTLACTARTVACAEVRLVRAGHAEEQTGWRQATPHVQMVEDAVRRARAEASSCQPPVVAAPKPMAAVPAVPVAPVTLPPPAPKPPAIVTANFTLPDDALFHFGKSGQADLLPGGQEKLAALAGTLKAFSKIQAVKVVGHTDRLGSDAFNDRLSAARAATVLAHLQSLGIKAVVASAQGVGKREPVTSSCSNKLARPALIACLQPDRRVTIEVAGIK